MPSQTPASEISGVRACGLLLPIALTALAVTGSHGHNGIGRMPDGGGGASNGALAAVRVRFIKLFGERHSATTYLEHELIAPLLLTPDLFLPSGCPNPPKGKAQRFLLRKHKDCTRLRLSRKDCQRLEHDERADRWFHDHYWSSLGWKHSFPPLPSLMFPDDHPKSTAYPSGPVRTTDQDRIAAVTGGGGRRSCLDTMIVVATRHPFDWVESLYHNTHLTIWPDPHGKATPARVGMSLQAFVRAQAPCPSRGNERGIGKDSAKPFVAQNHTNHAGVRRLCWRNPLDMWKRKLEGYARLAEAGCAVVATRYIDTTENGTRATCAIMLADVGDNRQSGRLWRPSAVRKCEADLAGAGGPAGGGRLIVLDGGGSVAVGPSHNYTVGWSDTLGSWANASLQRWMADELADLSPTAKLMTNYRYTV